MLTYATLLLCLTLTGDTVSSDGSLSTNITSTCHVYIHLVLDIHTWGERPEPVFQSIVARDIPQLTET